MLSDEAVSVMAQVARFLGHDKVAREETVIPCFLGLPVVAILVQVETPEVLPVPLLPTGFDREVGEVKGPVGGKERDLVTEGDIPLSEHIRDDDL